MGMVLTRLQLNSFRNYETLDLELEPGVSVFSGDNGQGKTNILEAVCYLGLLRSFRTSRIDLLKMRGGRNGFAVEGELRGADGASQRLSAVHAEKRRLAVDGLGVERAGEFINRFICVPFVLEDVEMIAGPAAERRRFLDICLCQEAPLYLAYLQRYLAALRQRNAVLREALRYGPSVLKAYDDLLVENGVPLLFMRQAFTERLNLQLERFSGMFFHDGRKLRARYASTLGKALDGETEPVVKSRFRELLAAGFAKDAEDGQTRTGPHRDELILHLGDRPLVAYASAGEQRIAALALRLASLEVLQRDVADGRSIVLLLDDVFGELDGFRRGDFFRALAYDQILVACTATPPELKGRCHEYFVSNGHCSRLN
jgi:DNA replication and repair protein RecF